MSQMALGLVNFEPWVVTWNGRSFEAKPAARIEGPADRYLPQASALLAAQTLTQALHGSGFLG